MTTTANTPETNTASDAAAAAMTFVDFFTREDANGLEVDIF